MRALGIGRHGARSKVSEAVLLNAYWAGRPSRATAAHICTGTAGSAHALDVLELGLDGAAVLAQAQVHALREADRLTELLEGASVGHVLGGDVEREDCGAQLVGHEIARVCGDEPIE